MLVILGYFDIDPAQVDAVEAAIAPALAATRQENGCQHYSLAFETRGSGSTPAKLALAEIWADEAALMAHMKAPHLAEFQKVFGPALRGADVNIYDGANKRPLKLG